jgi:hypothetical protein
VLTTDVAVLADVAFCFADVAIDSPTWQTDQNHGGEAKATSARTAARALGFISD